MSIPASQHKLIIGTISYGALTAPYLPFFKQSLKEQSFQDFGLIIHDNAEKNLGFGKAYNRMIEQAIAAGAKYFFIVNPDLILEPEVLEKLLTVLDNEPELSIVMPKLRVWDFEHNKKTSIIDSCGLGFKPCLNFFDYGQGQIDTGQYDRQEIIGASGAAAMFRLKDFAKIAENGQLFDEHFFMYKEDCDLAYRLYLKGMKSKLVPDAIAYHDRSSAAGTLIKRFFNRFKRSKNVNRWAFTNQHFLFIKYWSKQSFSSKLLAIIRMKIMFIEALLFEQYLLSCYSTIVKEAKTLKRY